MSAATAYEILGYAASALVVLSLAMRSILRLRIIGLVGSVAFMVYGILIGSYPVAITNFVILGIHLWFLREMLGKDEYFKILEVRPESLYLAYFCEFHLDEIRKFFPGWVHDPAEGERTLFVLRDLVPAGLWISRPMTDGSLEITLDFVIPQYRDFKVGSYVYSAGSGVLEGVDPPMVWTETGTPEHAAYLERMGFEPFTRDGRPVYRLGARG